MNSQKGALTPLAVENVDLLRALQAGGHASPGALAEACGRDKSNIARTLKRLHGGGLIDQPAHDAALTETALQVLAAADVAEGRVGSGAKGATTAAHQESRDDRATTEAQMPEGFALIDHARIFPDPLNPRKHFDPDALEELANSIATDGLLENLVVRPAEAVDWANVPVHRLVAGERRWRAIKLLMAQGRWRHGAIPCKVLDIDDAAHRRIALVENLQRKDLRPIDEAQALKELMAVTGQGTAEVAEQIGFTQRFVQQRLQLLQLPDGVQTKVNAGDVSIEKARAIAAILPDLPPAKAKELTAGKITPDQARSWLENQPKLRDDLTPRQWLILLEIADASLRGGRLGVNVQVGPAIADDTDWAALKALSHYFIGGPSPMWEQGFQVGQYVYLASYHDSLDQLRLKYGDALDEEQARWRLLAQARADAGVEFPLAIKAGEHAIPWLQGPFEIPAELQQKIAQAKADRAAAEARQAEEENAANRRRADAFNVSQSILVQHRKAELPPLDARFAETLAVFDVELPVTVAPNGDVMDAKGRQLVRSGYYDKAPPPTLARNTLLALAINAAAGLHTPETAKAADPDALPRGEFIEVVAGCLLEDIDDLDEAQAQAMAERGLAAYLAAEGIDYGHPDHDWEEGGAMAIAQGIREDGLGQAEVAPADPAEDEAA
jgi:ParB family chromosome partitioning protein